MTQTRNSAPLQPEFGDADLIKNLTKQPVAPDVFLAELGDGVNTQVDQLMYVPGLSKLPETKPQPQRIAAMSHEEWLRGLPRSKPGTQARLSVEAPPEDR